MLMDSYTHYPLPHANGAQFSVSACLSRKIGLEQEAKKGKARSKDQYKPHPHHKPKTDSARHHQHPHQPGPRFSAYLHDSAMHAFRDNPTPTREEAAHSSLSSFLSTITYVTAKPPSPPSFHCLLHITCTRRAKNSVPAIPTVSLFASRPAMQPKDSETDEPWSIQNRSLPIVLTFILLLFFLVSFFTLYLSRYVMAYLRTLRRRPVAVPRGLPTPTISSFPTLTYSSVKDTRHGNDELECSVCLAEFSDKDMLRMLTGCSHVFHLECIDLWLETHTTCPICRRDLDHGNNKKVEVVIQMPESNSRREGEGEAVAERHEHRNSFKEDDVDV